ncbi:MAG TPA: type II secretion system protein, partial [Verrucomicrobiae bacterium]|nr:type II secretion system protein [Verrucomicrobiae bacterium]
GNPGMRTTRCSRVYGAFTLIELLCVIAIIGVLVALLLPGLTQAKARARRVQCTSRLHQAGLAFQSFAQDHNGQFPMAVPGSAGGSLEFTRSSYQTYGLFFFSYHHFQALSNELVSPALVTCPSDTRTPAPTFTALQNANLSYIVGLNADAAHPTSVLAADRNLTNDWTGPSSLLRFGGSYTLRWTRELHQYKGNILFADGHVDEVNNSGLLARRNDLPVTADLVLPSIRETGTVAGIATPNLPGINTPATVPTERGRNPAGGPENTGSAPRQNEVVQNTSQTSAQAIPIRLNSGGAGSAASTIPSSKPADVSTNQSGASTSSGPPEDDPGFQLFPQAFIHAVLAAARLATWLALLLLALAVTLKLLQNRSGRSKKRRPSRFNGLT